METDYSIYRLNDEKELDIYRKQFGETAYREYLERLYNYIVNMKPGDKFRIDDLVKEQNRDLFIKLLCLFIWMHGTNTFLFSNDFRWFYCLKNNCK